MGYTTRTFLVEANDRIWRLTSKRYWEMLGRPDVHRLPEFSGQRMRIANLTVWLSARVPVRVAHREYLIATFDENGRLDVGEIMERISAHGDVILASAGAPHPHEYGETVVNAAAHFTVRGGKWAPTSALAQTLDEAALGQRRYPRL